MKKIIRKLFGIPYDNKLFKLLYWFGVVFYMIGAPLMIIINFFVVSKEILIMSLISIILYPILFRLVYNINVYLYKI